MPKVSVIIPTYNRSSLVKEAVESVLTQTFKDLEAIVVDDGSTDDTQSVLEAIDDDRVKYHYKENGGCANARNYGLAKSTGDYIAFLDSDDLWPENFLQIMVKNLESKPQYDALYSLIYGAYPDGTKKVMHEAKLCKTGEITKDLFKRSFIWLQTCVYRKNAFDKFTFDDSMRNGADTDAILRLSTRIKFLFVRDTYAILRLGHGISPRQDHSSINCNRIRVLERFYYELGGDKFVTKTASKRKISHAYRHVAKNYYKNNCRTATLFLYRKAINYWPLDIRLYKDLFRAYLLDGKQDKMPDWEMPSPLPDIEF